MCGAQGEKVVVLCLLLEPGVPGHRRGSAAEVGHHTEQAPLHVGRLVLFQVACHFIELSDDGFATQAASESVVPCPEGARRRLQFSYFALADTTSAPLAVGYRCRLKPAFQRVEQGGTGQGSPG